MSDLYFIHFCVACLLYFAIFNFISVTFLYVFWVNDIKVWLIFFFVDQFLMWVFLLNTGEIMFFVHLLHRNLSWSRTIAWSTRFKDILFCSRMQKTRNTSSYYVTHSTTWCLFQQTMGAARPAYIRSRSTWRYRYSLIWTKQYNTVEFSYSQSVVIASIYTYDQVCLVRIKVHWSASRRFSICQWSLLRCWCWCLPTAQMSLIMLYSM